MKLPTVIQEYLSTTYPGMKLYVTSTDRRHGRIYPIVHWVQNERVFAERTDSRDLAATRRRVKLSADKYGSTESMDGQGRVLLSPDLRRDLKMENQPVRVRVNGVYVEVIPETEFQILDAEAAASSVADSATMELNGMC